MRTASSLSLSRTNQATLDLSRPLGKMGLGRLVIRLEWNDFRIGQRGQSVGGACAVTVGIMHSPFPRRRKFAADRGPHRMDGTAHTLANLALERDAPGTLLVRPFHHQTVVRERLRQISRDRSPRGFGAFSLVKGNTKMSATSSARGARIVVVVVPRKGGIPPLVRVIHVKARSRSQNEAAESNVKIGASSQVSLIARPAACAPPESPPRPGPGCDRPKCGPPQRFCEDIPAL